MSFEKILWNIAGAEIPILETCRTDHKKFSAIGATILMTAFIAFCAGTSAAWYFSQNGNNDSGSIGWSIAFGLIWAILIFCIDRSLVVTLKKDPSKEKQPFWIPLLSRAALAVVVSFMVSIPLELVIFEDYIEANKENFEADRIAILSEQLKKNSDEKTLNNRISEQGSAMKGLKESSTELKGEISNLQDRINSLENAKNNPASERYKNAKNRYNQAYKDLNNITYKYNIENKKDNPSSYLLNEYNTQKKNAQKAVNAAKNEMTNAAIEWRNQKQAEIEKLVPQRDAKQAEKLEKDKSYNTILSAQQVDISRAQKTASDRETIEDKKKEKMSKGNHFIQNYQILEYAVWQKHEGVYTEKTQLMFLWFIRSLFFIIELLPTIVKIITKPGAYEWKIKAEEDEIKENIYLYKETIKQNNLCHTESQIRITQELLQQEEKLKKDLQHRIMEVQLEVANKAIIKWKETELKKLRKETSVKTEASFKTIEKAPFTPLSPVTEEPTKEDSPILVETPHSDIEKKGSPEDTLLPEKKDTDSSDIISSSKEDTTQPENDISDTEERFNTDNTK